MVYQTFSINHKLYYPRLLLCEHGNSCDLFLCPGLNYGTSLNLTVCLTNFYHNYLVYWPTVGGTGILNRWHVSMPHFLFCLYVLEIVKFGPRIEHDLLRLS